MSELDGLVLFLEEGGSEPPSWFAGRLRDLSLLGYLQDVMMDWKPGRMLACMHGEEKSVKLVLVGDCLQRTAGNAGSLMLLLAGAWDLDFWNCLAYIIGIAHSCEQKHGVYILHLGHPLLSRRVSQYSCRMVYVM